MPCAIPPVDLAVARIGWHKGMFFYPRSARTAPVPHDGLDFMADEGAPVVAAYDGVVVHVGRQPYGYAGSRPGLDALGHYVVIHHPDLDEDATVSTPRQRWTRYAHLRAASSLRVGQRVRAGDLVGYVGTSGQAPGRRRPRLFFQTVRERADAADFAHGIPGDPVDFFGSLGLTIRDAQAPGPPIEEFEQVPAWGGTAEESGACRGVAGLGSAHAGSGIQNPRYSKYGTTQLSDSRPYPPARYDAEATDTSWASQVFFWACWLTGTAAGLYVLRRVMVRRGLGGLGACPCDTNPNGATCQRLVRRALARQERRKA